MKRRAPVATACSSQVGLPGMTRTLLPVTCSPGTWRATALHHAGRSYDVANAPRVRHGGRTRPRSIRPRTPKLSLCAGRFARNSTRLADLLGRFRRQPAHRARPHHGRAAYELESVRSFVRARQSTLGAAGARVCFAGASGADSRGHSGRAVFHRSIPIRICRGRRERLASDWQARGPPRACRLTPDWTPTRPNSLALPRSSRSSPGWMRS